MPISGTIAIPAAGVAPDVVLHVGDDALLDAHDALNAGMQAAWANTEGAVWLHEGETPHVTVASFAALCRLLA